MPANKKTTELDIHNQKNSPLDRGSAPPVKGLALVAAHSGGHIIPCLTIAEQKKSLGPATVLFITSTSSLDTKIVTQSKAVDHLLTLPLTTIPYRKPWLWPKTFFNYARAFFSSLNALRRHKPNKVITTGGSIAIPVCFAAWLLRIPIELFELNVEPGKTIKLLAPLASKIHIVFGETQHYFKNRACEVASYPVRFSQDVKTSFNRETELNKLGFSSDRKTIFVIGGSQGSHFLNELMKIVVEHQRLDHIQVIHQTGSYTETEWSAFYKERAIPAVTFAYHHNLAPLYQLADVVITRAGSGTLAELKFFDCKTIIIPLVASTTSHQVDNARAYARMFPDLFTVCLQRDIEKNPALFHEAIDKILRSKIMHRQVLRSAHPACPPKL